jgi:signal peptidase I
MNAYFRKNASFFLFMITLIAVRWSFADQYRVPTGSMEPTIHVGDHVFINKAAYGVKIPFTDFRVLKTGHPHRGEIVVFTSPENPSMNLIKRLIAVPGDQVQIENGVVSINGSPITGSEQVERHLIHASAEEFYYEESLGSAHYQVKRLPGLIRPERIEFKVPEDRYFFMGDNRDNSHDGRFFGFVEGKSLKGRALGVLWNIRMENGLPEMDIHRTGARL